MDLGGGHSYVLTVWSPDRELNPQYEDIEDCDPYGAIVFHTNLVTGEPCAGAIVFDGETQRKLEPDRKLWGLNSLEPLDVEGSVLCRYARVGEAECGDHGYIREGRWVVA